MLSDHFDAVIGKDLADVTQSRRCDPGFTRWIGDEEEQVQAGRSSGDFPCIRSSLLPAIYRFRQLTFELAWTLMSERRYQEAADAFMSLLELNSWCAMVKRKKSRFS